MARPLRIEYPGAWHHVMNRGQGKRQIFLTENDRISFLNLIGDASEMFSLKVYAYSLMDNHYHLLIHTPSGNLGRAMRHINGVYTQRFNYFHGSDGSLFRGRYKARIVESEEYLLELVRYIHLNPVKGGLTNHPGEHRWTSHSAYIREKYRPKWLSTAEVLDRFGKNKRSALSALNQFVQAGVPEHLLSLLEEENILVGSRGFREWIYENFMDNNRHQKEVSKAIRVPRPKLKPTELLQHVAFAYNVPVSSLRKRMRGVENEPYFMACYLLLQILGLSQKEIARWLHCNTVYAVATVQRRFRERLQREKQLQKKVGQLSNSFMTHVKT